MQSTEKTLTGMVVRSMVERGLILPEYADEALAALTFQMAQHTRRFVTEVMLIGGLNRPPNPDERPPSIN